MPELRSGARQSLATSVNPSLAPIAATLAPGFPDAPAIGRRTPSRRRIAAAVVDLTSPVGNRVRTRAAVAQEAAVVTPTRVGEPAAAGVPASKGRAPGGAARATRQARPGKPAVNQRAAPSARKKVVYPVSPPASRPQDPEPSEDRHRLHDVLKEDLDLVQVREVGPSVKQEMEEESAGRSADKVPGAEEEGSTAPLPERVRGSVVCCSRPLSWLCIFNFAIHLALSTPLHLSLSSW